MQGETIPLDNAARAFPSSFCFECKNVENIGRTNVPNSKLSDATSNMRNAYFFPQLRDFAESQHLPVIAENCPACFESPKERHRTKQVNSMLY
jgi:hypothetical protein